MNRAGGPGFFLTDHGRMAAAMLGEPFFPISFDTGEVPALAGLAQAHDATPRQIALAWLLHRGGNVIPIPGTTSAGHLRENLDALKISLTPSEVSALASRR